MKVKKLAWAIETRNGDCSCELAKERLLQLYYEVQGNERELDPKDLAHDMDQRGSDKDGDKRIGVEQAMPLFIDGGRQQLKLLLEKGAVVVSDDFPALGLPVFRVGQELIVKGNVELPAISLASIQVLWPEEDLRLLAELQLRSESVCKAITKICTELGSCLLWTERALSIHGQSEELSVQTEQELQSLLFQHQHRLQVQVQVPVQTQPHAQSEDATTHNLEKAALQSECQLILKRDSDSAWLLGDFLGNAQEIKDALRGLNFKIDYLHYERREKKQIRDFVAGKKDGKLAKIMRETGTQVELPTSAEKEETNATIAISGSDPAALAQAIAQLEGECPAELLFHLSEAHHKRLIGHGGQTIQRIMRKWAVYIKFLSPVESIERHPGGSLMAALLPRSMQLRLPNVLVRTPSKNQQALLAAKHEILAMAEEEEATLVHQRLDFSSMDLHLAEESTRQTIKALFAKFADTLEITMPNSHSLHLRGYSSPALQRLLSDLSSNDIFVKKEKTEPASPLVDWSNIVPPSPSLSFVERTLQSGTSSSLALSPTLSNMSVQSNASTSSNVSFNSFDPVVGGSNRSRRRHDDSDSNDESIQTPSVCSKVCINNL